MHAAAVESEVQNANNNQCWPRPKNWYNNDDEYCCCCADSRRCISKKMPNGLLQSAGCRFFQSLNECDFNNVSLCIAENATKHARTQRTHEDGYRISTISASFWTRFFFTSQQRTTHAGSLAVRKYLWNRIIQLWLKSTAVAAAARR